MLAKKISNFSRTFAIILIASACAYGCVSQNVKPDSSSATDSALPLAENETSAPDTNALLATETSPNADPFADLSKAESKSKTNNADNSDRLNVEVSDQPYYDAVGGETLLRVSNTLYRSKKFVSELLEKNPGLEKGKKLSAGSKVVFDLGHVNPKPNYLTKGLLDRYKDDLGKALISELVKEMLPKKSLTVETGDTLQTISERLYGDSRFWPEIYLVNRTDLPSYDKITPGQSLIVYEHPMVVKAEKIAKVAKVTPAAAILNTKKIPPAKKSAVVVKQAEQPKVAKTNQVSVPREQKITSASMPPPPPAPVKVSTQPLKPMKALESPLNSNTQKLASLPLLSPLRAAEKTEATRDVITPKTNQSALRTPPTVSQPQSNNVLPVPLPKTVEKKNTEVETVAPSENSKFRRIVYVSLIVAIAGLAFFLTRPKKRPKIDLSHEGDIHVGRPKLPPDVNQNVG